MYNSIILFIARILSTVLHPFLLFLPVPYFLVLHITNNVESAIKWTFFSWIFIFSVVVFVFYEVQRGRFSNYDISKQGQRSRFFLFVGLMTIIYISCLFLLHGPLEMVIVTFGSLLGLLLLDIINKYVKASIHVASVSAILLSFVILNGFSFIWLLLFIPLVAWSRVKLKSHTVLETITGGLFGILLTILVYVIIEYVFKY
ncbi:MAG TPA: hypothetical protein VMR41_03695 [Patescibacteria group bacterium]|nr:hypothetical protein [Patescibacteria group bacterium]